MVAFKVSVFEVISCLLVLQIRPRFLAAKWLCTAWQGFPDRPPLPLHTSWRPWACLQMMPTGRWISRRWWFFFLSKENSWLTGSFLPPNPQKLLRTSFIFIFFDSYFWSQALFSLHVVVPPKEKGGDIKRKQYHKYYASEVMAFCEVLILNSFLV